jgi:hypothetical protein
MRIGIITFHDAVNYGAVLQCYALSQYLVKCGHDVEVIDYHRVVSRRADAPKRRLVDYPRLALNKFKRKIDGRKQDPKRVLFEAFVERELSLTERRYHGVDALREDPPKCDAYICGSDQIWNDRFWNGFDEGYFLRFGGEAIKRIAYAPGVPGSEFERAGIDRFRELIADFNAISARETIGQGLIEQAIGERVPVVVDPTILYGHYEDILESVDVPAEFILSYGLPAYDSVQAHVDGCVGQLKTKLQLTVVAVKMGNDPAVKTQVYAPFEWLWLIRHATKFVTNSYHGLIFALLFKQDVYVLPRDGNPDGQDARLLYLLNRYGLMDRYIGSSDQSLNLTPIDWERVSELMEQDRLQSSEFLQAALS